MKKAFAFVCVLLSFVLCSCKSEFTVSIEGRNGFKTGDKYEYVLCDGGIKLTDCNDFSSMHLVIPTTIDGYDVVALGTEFLDCNYFTYITLPETLKVIETCAIYNCWGFRSINIPESVEMIYPDAFSGSEIQAIYVDPKNQYYADSDCALYTKDYKTLLYFPPHYIDSLTYVIPEGTEYIEKTAFSTPPESLCYLYVPTTLKNFPKDYIDPLRFKVEIFLQNNQYLSKDDITFESDALVLNGIGYGRAVDGLSVLFNRNTLSSAMPNYADGKPITELCADSFESYNHSQLTLPNTLKRINAFAFRSCYLEMLAIPVSVTYIDPAAFVRGFISAYYVDKYNTKYISINGVIYTKDMKTLVAYPQNANRTTFTIPDGVERINEHAFSGNTLDLQRLRIPSSVKEFSVGSLGESMKTVKIEFY